MKKDFFSIEDLAQGKCAVVNDGTFDDLMKVLSRLNLTPWDESCIFHARYLYIFKNEDGEWDASNETTLPTQSVKDFLHGFRVGDLVTWSLNGCVGTITNLRKGEAVINFGNESMAYDAKVSDLTPYYKKGDKAEVVKDLVLLGFKKGDILEFIGDNIIDGFRLSDGSLKDKIKRVRRKPTLSSTWNFTRMSNKTADNLTKVLTEMKHSHYNNENGSLYKIAEQLELNAYEFDILKRIARCRKKGQFKQDLQKIKDTVDLYLKEVDHD